MKLFQAVSRYLAEERNNCPVFGLLGDANLGYMGAFIEQENGNYVAAAHEGGAVSMGDGWARATGHVGVVTVTHGPALTNTLTALTEATKSNTPMVLLSGSTPDVNEHYQYIDLEGFARLAGSGFLKVRNADEALTILDRAFTRAAGDRLPVLVDIPAGILWSDVGYRAPRIPKLTGKQRLPDPQSVKEVAGLLTAAERPLLVAGRGAVDAGARDKLLELARAVNAPVATTLQAKDYFDGEPENLGILGGLSTPPLLTYMDDVDLLISFGASLNGFTTNEFSLLEGRTIVQTDIKPTALNAFGPATHAILADSKSMASALVDSVYTMELSQRRADCMKRIAQAPYRESKDLYRSTTGNGFIDMRDATRWLSDVLPHDAQQVCDVGRFGYSTWPHITVDPKRWFYIGGFGSIGLGLSAAIGISVASPEAPTALYVGDGGIMQGLGELATAVRNRLPLIVMVLNDQCYGAEYLKLQQFKVSAEHSMMDWPSLSKVAESLGANALEVRSVHDFTTAATMVNDREFPLFIEVMANPRDVPNSPGVVPLERSRTS